MTSEISAIAAPDRSARAGLFVGAAAIGASFQPNLLTRSTRDQAIISGVSAIAGYTSAIAGHALWHSASRRLPLGDTLFAETGLALTGFAVSRAVPPAEHESDRRAMVRLIGNGGLVIGGSALASRLVRRLGYDRPGSEKVAIAATATLGTALGTYFALRPKSHQVGALRPDGSYFEDQSREVNSAEAVAVGGAVTAALVGVAHAESYVTRLVSRGAARVFGGEPADHRTLGRVVTFGVIMIGGRAGVSTVVRKLNQAGDSFEAAHKEAPVLAEVTGCRASQVSWEQQSREGRRWLGTVLLKDHIGAVMGEEAKQPIRVYASLEAASSDEERAALLMRELDRTGAFDRSVLALFSPTGSGYVNYVATETLEYLTRGDCASACVEYSVLPSSLSLTAVPLGTRQTRLVVDAIVQRFLWTPPDQRPRFLLFGESLGSQVSQGMFTDQGVDGPKSAALDAAVWVGTPSASKWRKQLWGARSVTKVPDVGPGAAYLPRNILEWHALPPAERARVKWLLLQNGDDPIPKFGEQLLWRRPDWLGHTQTRPPGSPKGTTWFPFITFFQTFFDMLNALTPTPGIFAEGGHDYRVEIPEALRQVWKLDATDEQMARVQEVLRKRELGWEVARKWDAAEEITDAAKRAKAEAKAGADVTTWVGESESLTALQLEQIIAQDTQPD